jgi:hypothetical protein
MWRMAILRVLDRHSVRLGTGLAAALVVVVGFPSASAEASSKPPVVNVSLDTTRTPKLSGAGHLQAGWVTFQVSAADGLLHFVSLERDLPGAPSPSAKASAQLRGIHPATMRQRASAQSGGSGRSAPATSESYADQAKDVRAAEKEFVPLGGTQVSGRTSSAFTVQLPAGTVVLSDAPFTTVSITVGKGANHSKPERADAVVSEGSDNVLHSPSTLPRSGTLEIRDTNTSGAGWHSIMLMQLGKGVGEAAIKKWFGQTGNSFSPAPYVETPVTGPFSRLAARHSIYFVYSHLSPGKYALADAEIDDRTGHVHAAGRSVELITVK